MALSVGTVLGAYEIVALIGAGGMGEVYRARDTRLRRRWPSRCYWKAWRRTRTRFVALQQEALAAAALNHPNILAVYDTGVAGGVPFVVTELLDGQMVAERLLQGPLPLPKALDYAVQIATGLIAAHDHGIVHRDLKPDNVFITRDERVKILDFGVAKLTEPGPALEGRTTITGTNPGTLLGTVGYMSPEQVRGEVIDHRSDLFSFGVLFDEMLTAERAFRRDTPIDILSAILHDELHDVSVADPSLPAALGRVVRHCLQKRRPSAFNPRETCASRWNRSLASRRRRTMERGELSGGRRDASVSRGWRRSLRLSSAPQSLCGHSDPRESQPCRVRIVSFASRPRRPRRPSTRAPTSRDDGLTFAGRLWPSRGDGLT